MAIFRLLPPRNTKYRDYLSSLLCMTVLDKHPFLFRKVHNFDVRIQYTKCIQSGDKDIIDGKTF